MQGDVRQGLAVQFQPGGLQPVYKLAVGYAGFAARRIDADDPQGAEVALFGKAAAIERGEVKPARVFKPPRTTFLLRRLLP